MNLPFCNVALPVPLRNTFTYAIPDAMRDSVQPGSRVLVPFRNKSLVGVVVECVQQAPPATKIREITKVMDFLPALTPKVNNLARGVAGCPPPRSGEFLRGFPPPVTELRTERQIVLTDSGRAAAEKEAATAVHATQRNIARSADSQQRDFLSQLRDKGGVMPFASAVKLGFDEAALQRLRGAGLIEIRESMLGRKAKTQRVIAWKENASTPVDAPGKATQNAQTSRSQEKASRTQALEEKINSVMTSLHARGPLPLAQLLRVAQVSRSLIERMLRDGFLESWEERIDPAEDPFDVGYVPPAHELNAEQDSALKLIRARFELGEFGVLLLHGVTGSGKTEGYIRAVQGTLACGKTAIILVPEIALTLWIGRQCRAWFGARFEGVAVLHSALSDVERAREWWRVRNGEARVVVGTRSAIFAPLQNLGLIIVDEEQESSYKQEETPRYHGRDVAIVRAQMENAAALLGSAPPSLATYHHARSGKYELLTLASRVEQRAMASVEVVDLREDFAKTHQTSPISAALHAGIAECLAQKTQALVLINRRGYSWSVLCRSFGASLQCENCSNSMTHHKQRNRLEIPI